MTVRSHAVFLSYASEDAPAAPRIAEALRSAGIEVWFDQSALRGDPDDSGVDSLVCLSATYEKLRRHADAQATLGRFMKLHGDADAYAYAEVYAQWGDTAKTLEWLEKALRLRDSGFILLKTDPLMDPLRHEPRFQAIRRQLKFPD